MPASSSSPPTAPVGARYIDVVPFDPVIDVAVTPNRPDALGVAGIARDLAARGLGTLKTPPVEAVPGGYPCPVAVYLAPDVATEACPLFVGRLIRGVSNGPSPQWLQDRLRADRPPADLRAGRHHQLHHLRPRPAAARLRRRQGAWADHRPPGAARRDAAARSTARTTPSTAPRRWSATRTAPRVIGGVMGGAAHRLHRGDHQRLRRGRLVRSGPHRPHRPAAQGQLRCPLPLRARRRSRRSRRSGWSSPRG